MAFSAVKALKSRIVMLSGEEPQLRSRALSELFAEAGVQRDDLDLEFVTMGSRSSDEWIASVSTVPFLSERRIVVVRSILSAEVDAGLVASLKSIPESGLLILIADEEATASEDRLRRLSTIRAKWEKAVTECGGCVEAFKTNPKETKETVRREATRLGKSLSERAAETLIEMCGGSLSRAIDELEKVSLYVGAADQIREADIAEVVVPSREWNVFKLIDAIAGGAVPEALRQLRILIGGQAKAEDAAFSRILPMMLRQIRLVWQARLCIDAGCTPDRASAELRASFLTRPSIADEQPYRQSSFMAIARRVDLAGLSKCFSILADTDARLKGALPSFSGVETLERMVLEMSAELAAR